MNLLDNIISKSKFLILLDRFIKNIEPNCFSYNKHCKGIVKLNDTRDWSPTLVGKNCDDDFCPINTTCKQLELLAHCFY